MGSSGRGSPADMPHLDDNYRHMNDVAGGGGKMTNAGHAVQQSRKWGYNWEIMFAYVTIFQQAGQLQGIAETGDRKQSRCVPWLSAFYDTEMCVCSEKPGCHVLTSCLFKTAQRHFCPGMGGREELPGKRRNLQSLALRRQRKLAKICLHPSVSQDRVALTWQWAMAVYEQHWGAHLHLLPSPPSGDFCWPHGSASLSESISTFAW